MKVSLAREKNGGGRHSRPTFVPYEITFVRGEDQPYAAALKEAALDARRISRELRRTSNFEAQFSIVDPAAYTETVDGHNWWRARGSLYLDTHNDLAGIAGEEVVVRGVEARQVYEGVMHGLGVLAHKGMIDAAALDALCAGISYVHSKTI